MNNDILQRMRDLLDHIDSDEARALVAEYDAHAAENRAGVERPAAQGGTASQVPHSPSGSVAAGSGEERE